MNAGEIARGLSPLRPETVSVQAGRLMLAFKKYKQSPVIVSREDRIVAVPPEDMPPAPPLE